MRKSLEVFCLAALAWISWITYQAVYGPDHLPARIPTHFDMAGNPNGWGSPAGLLLLPIIALAIYVFMTVIALFPSTFHFSMPVTAENRPRLEALAIRVIALCKVEMLCLFLWIQHAIIEAARSPQQTFAATGYLIPVFVVVILGTVGWHVLAMYRAARPGAEM